MSETSSTTFQPKNHSETVANLTEETPTPVDTSSAASVDDEEVLDDEEYEIEYEYEDDDVDGELNSADHATTDDEEYSRIANRIDELLNKANDLKSEVSAGVEPTVSPQLEPTPRTESSQSATSVDDELLNEDEEYEYEYEYEDEPESVNSPVENSSNEPIEHPPVKVHTKQFEQPASAAITQAPFQDKLPDFGQLRHASNKWNIAAISGEDAETNFDEEDECNEIEIALEEPPTAKTIVGQLERLLEEDEQDEVDELMPDAFIQQTSTENPLLLGVIDLPVTPSPAPSPLPGQYPGCRGSSSPVPDSGSALLQQVRAAALNDQPEVLCSLLDSNPGFFIDAILKAGWTALMYGAYRSNVDIVHECLARGADPNYHKECFTPLMAVCCSRLEMPDSGCFSTDSLFAGHARMLDTMRLLLSAGGSVDSKDKFGCTPLQYATRFGRRHLVSALLDAGASIDTPNCNGWTALHWAAAEGHRDVVETLLSHGADPNLKTAGPEMELTPGEMAAMKNYDDIADRILNASFVNNTVNNQPEEVKSDVGTCEITPTSQTNSVSCEAQLEISADRSKSEERETKIEPLVQNTDLFEANQSQAQSLSSSTKSVGEVENGEHEVSAKEELIETETPSQESPHITVLTADHENTESIKNDVLPDSVNIEPEVSRSLSKEAPISSLTSLPEDDIELASLLAATAAGAPELRKRTTLVIHEWDEDHKRILSNQTQQHDGDRRRSSVTVATDARSVVLSLVVAALLFLLFRSLLRAIFG